MATININGTIYRGNSVSIVNGRVTVDGVEQKGSALSGVVEIRVTEGVLGSLQSDASVSCGSVSGDVRAGGSVSCEEVGGNVQGGGSVSCGRVGGSVMAGGSVSHG